MTACTIIGVLVHCLFAGPRLTPQQAADLLAHNASVSRAMPTPRLSSETFITSSPDMRTWISSQPPRRLDGTPYTQPPINYGAPWWVTRTGGRNARKR